MLPPLSHEDTKLDSCDTPTHDPNLEAFKR